MALTTVTIAVPVTAAISVAAAGVLARTAVFAVALLAARLLAAAEQGPPHPDKDAGLARGFYLRYRRRGGGGDPLHGRLLRGLAIALGGRQGRRGRLGHELV